MSTGQPSQWLVMRLGAMGDVLLTTGVMDYWRRTRGLRFSVLTKHPWGELLHGHPAVEDVLELDSEALRTKSFIATARELAARLSDHGLLDLHGTTRSRMVSLLWKGEVRRYPKMAMLRRAAGLTRWPSLLEKLERLTVPQRYALALEEAAPPSRELAPHIWLQQEELAAAREMLADHLPFAGQTRVAALHPFAAHESKRWPVTHWRELRRMLLDAGWSVFIVGSAATHEGLAPLKGEQAHYTSDLTRQTSPRQSAALLACADVLITGDSGPMHLATAVGTPVVALFGPTTRAWGFFPQGATRRGKHVVLERDLGCRPCSLHGKKACNKKHECLEGITPDIVMRGVIEAAGPLS